MRSIQFLLAIGLFCSNIAFASDDCSSYLSQSDVVKALQATDGSFVAIEREFRGRNSVEIYDQSSAKVPVRVFSNTRLLGVIPNSHSIVISVQSNPMNIVRRMDVLDLASSYQSDLDPVQLSVEGLYAPELLEMSPGGNWMKVISEKGPTVHYQRTQNQGQIRWVAVQ
mgnify:CR=1 FL=1